MSFQNGHYGLSKGKLKKLSFSTLIGTLEGGERLWISQHYRKSFMISPYGMITSYKFAMSMRLPDICKRTLSYTLMLLLVTRTVSFYKSSIGVFKSSQYKAFGHSLKVLVTRVIYKANHRSYDRTKAAYDRTKCVCPIILIGHQISIFLPLYLDKCIR